MKKPEILTTDHKYLRVAEGLEQMINDEVLRIGDKLPSVRTLSEEYSISMGTAFQAYYHLEGRGLIEARPKSGYYVRFSKSRYPELPQLMEQDLAPHDVTVKEMIASIYRDIVASDVVNLALAVPDASLLPGAKLNKSVMYALKTNPQHCLNYEDTQGNFQLRQQLTRLAFNWGGSIKPADIIITSGCLDAITLSLRAVTKPGDTVGVESPVYFGIFQAIEALGLRVVELPTNPVTGLNPDQLTKIISKNKLKAVVTVPSFNNPVGSCMPDEMKKKLVEIVTAHQIPLIEDDIYGELYFGKNRPKPCKYFDREGYVIYCCSFSKSLAPGYRIGWTMPGKYLDKVKDLKRIQNISSPTLTQEALAHFLQHGRYEYHLKQLRKSLHTQSLRYLQAIIDYFPADVKVSRPHGGYSIWVQLNRKVDSFRLRTEAMREKISIVPGKIFSATGNYANCIRISFGKPWSDEIENGLMTLGNLIKKMK